MRLSAWFQSVLEDNGCVIAAISQGASQYPVQTGTWICGSPFRPKYLMEMTIKMSCT